MTWGDEPAASGDIRRWYAEVQRASAADFAARHQGLFFLAGQPRSELDKVDFRTREARSRLEAAADVARSEQGEICVIPIEKSPRNPYKDRISIGRARNCDIVIRHPSISKLHAHIRVHEDKSYTIIDLGSHNGTSIDARQLAPNVAERLGVDSVVVLGTVVLRVLDAERLREELVRRLALSSERGSSSLELSPPSRR
ncbi:FHA domain-containing protein [Sorangium sp. So ce1389]|uniref:FHA domain-containing protein n=1 Tax=Sorangium sp. So ce1389 TaxID=3133336 RepID=UPI003F5FE3FA